MKIIIIIIIYKVPGLISSSTLKRINPNGLHVFIGFVEEKANLAFWY